MLRNKIIETHVNVNDFWKEIQPILDEKGIEDKKLGKRGRKTSLCESEAISLLILFHSEQFSNLTSFYMYFHIQRIYSLVLLPIIALLNFNPDVD